MSTRHSARLTRDRLVPRERKAGSGLHEFEAALTCEDSHRNEQRSTRRADRRHGYVVRVSDEGGGWPMAAIGPSIARSRDGDILGRTGDFDHRDWSMSALETSSVRKQQRRCGGGPSGVIFRPRHLNLPIHPHANIEVAVLKRDFNECRDAYGKVRRSGILLTLNLYVSLASAGVGARLNSDHDYASNEQHAAYEVTSAQEAAGLTASAVDTRFFPGDARRYMAADGETDNATKLSALMSNEKFVSTYEVVIPPTVDVLVGAQLVAASGMHMRLDGYITRIWTSTSQDPYVHATIRNEHAPRGSDYVMTRGRLCRPFEIRIS